MSWTKLIPALALALVASGSARAGFVTNGSFETTTNGANKQFDLLTQATGWTSPGNAYNFIYSSGAADTTGAAGQYGTVKLWGPNDGSANGLTASSPDGGNFVAADSNFQSVAIQQTLTGLSIGKIYQVGFWWAGAQQAGFDGATTAQWRVGFGGQTKSTAVANVASHGFTGWMYQTFNFTADGTSDVLSFLAVGTPPSGAPPFALLDGVSVNSVPEPSTLLLMGLGMLGVGGISLRRRARSAA